MAKEMILQIGDKVTAGTFGAGVIMSRDNVESPSDGDHAMYTVKMENGEIRHFKTADFK